ncbi:hypothetical protein BCR32DRAFT_275613 [Anaeromyces robustus]|uniref:Phospholipid/glycerol acyltransferase domain-containing protein n=1 Tax=Anaeromyces robustus TaxID=1754192 RepID=A0A1Y1XKI9_9FUNG|nr:hypothetical protein BCR32DRAFT_275613 [Anaeromyces robustus]|eukprot:ORX86222.1 hypothetical protein BCR32DRAFT_275613 [Anaeromyces robustus]
MCNPIIGCFEAAIHAIICVGFCLICNVFQIISLAVYPFNKQIFYEFNSFLAGSVWWILQFMFEKVRHGHITFSGDILPNDESAIVIANHRSYVDFYLVHAVGKRKKQLPNLKYFLKDSLKFLPAFGWGMYIMRMIFVKRDWTSDKTKIEQTFSEIKKLENNFWIVSYLEGSRITPEKLKASQEFSKKKGYPILDNVLIPRTKGFIATLHSFKDSKVKYVYDFTLVYGHKERGYGVFPSIPRIFMGRIDTGYRFHVHIKRIPISSIPEDDEEITKWAVQLYKEKNDFLEEMKHNWTDNIELIDMNITPDDIKKDE